MKALGSHLGMGRAKQEWPALLMACWWPALLGMGGGRGDDVTFLRMNPNGAQIGCHSQTWRSVQS